MTHILYRDYETRNSAVDLRKVGAHSYAADARTEINIVCYAVDNGPVKRWLPDDDSDVPPEFIAAATEPDWIAVAHNVNFERLIERGVLGPQHNFPVIPITRQRCTMAMVQALALPASLEGAASALNLINQKDKAGNRVMKRMAKPRRPRKGEDPDGLYWADDELLEEDLYEYCEQDVEVTRELYQTLPPLSDEEQRLWELDAKINDFGFTIDRRLIQAAIKIAEAANPQLDKEIAEITSGAVTSFNQVAKLLAWVNSRGIDARDLNKKTIDALMIEKLPDDVRRALNIRLLGAQAAVKKLNAIWDRREMDDRVRGAFIFHAAGTGRWSSKGVQVHNLKRLSLLPEELEEAIKFIMTGSYEKMRARYQNPLAVMGGCIRAVICAPIRKKLLGADFSGIEARVTAWLAGETRKLKIFKQFDDGSGPDPYVVAAVIVFKGHSIEDIDKKKRNVGKAAELAFGYQGGVNAFRKFAPDSEYTDDQIQTIKMAWRRAHPSIERFWHSVNRAAIQAVMNPCSLVRCGKVAFKYRDDCAVPILWLVLPSGRKLAYPDARIERTLNFNGKIVVTDKGKAGIIFKDNSSGQWRDVRMYGGLLTENIVQAIARDLLAEAMLRIDAAGFNIATHVHDEVVVEIEENEKREAEFAKLMVAVPPWGEGIPIVAKPWKSERYVK